MRNLNFSPNRLFAALFLICASLTAKANNYPPIVPSNMNAVVAQILADYGSQIQITQDELVAFLNSVQTAYDPDLGTPEANAVAGGPTYATFEMASSETYATGVINLENGSSSTDAFTGDNYTFDGLSGEKLHLFAFVTTGGGSTQGPLQVIILKPVDLIIIIDIEIILDDACEGLVSVANSPGSATVILPVGSAEFYQIRILPAPNSPVVPDYFTMKISNVAGDIRVALLDPSQEPENGDNYITTSGKLASNTPDTRTIRFSALSINNSFTYNAFRIADEMPNSGFPIIVQVDECTGYNEDPNGGDDQPPSTEWIPPSLPIAPNPAYATSTLSVAGLDLTDARLSIANIQGQVLATRSNLPLGASALQMDFSQLPPDMYVITLKTRHATYHSKVLKVAE